MFKNPDFSANNRMSLFGDKKYDFSLENRAFNYKHVFRVWVRQVYRQEFSEGMIKHEEEIYDYMFGETVDSHQLTQRQMENIFPEFRARLKLYKECCN